MGNWSPGTGYYPDISNVYVTTTNSWISIINIFCHCLRGKMTNQNRYDILHMVCTYLTLNGTPSQTISSSPLKSPSGILMSYLLHEPRSPDTSTLMSVTCDNILHNFNLIAKMGLYCTVGIQQFNIVHYSSLFQYFFQSAMLVEEGMCTALFLISNWNFTWLSIVAIQNQWKLVFSRIW